MVISKVILCTSSFTMSGVGLGIFSGTALWRWRHYNTTLTDTLLQWKMMSQVTVLRKEELGREEVEGGRGRRGRITYAFIHVDTVTSKCTFQHTCIYPHSLPHNTDPPTNPPPYTHSPTIQTHPQTLPHTLTPPQYIPNHKPSPQYIPNHTPHPTQPFPQNTY